MPCRRTLVGITSAIVLKRRRASSEVNLATIAKRLDLSISTVSRALRNEQGINPDTRERVVEMAKAVGYLTGGEIVTATRARPLNILAMGQCSMATVDQRYLAGMSTASVALNLSIISHHVMPDAVESILDPARQPINMRNGLIDGIVLLHRWPDHIAAKLSEQYPVVSIVHSYPGLPIDLVGTDDRQGILALAKHLLACGHRRIGFFGLTAEVSWARSRFAAYIEAMVTLGLPANLDDVVWITLDEATNADPFPEGTWSAAVDACAARGVTAWIAASAGTGTTLCRHFLSQGLSIPGDVAITGFHQQAYSVAGLPRLTAMDVADEELGSAALRRLVHRIKNPDESRRTILLPVVFSPGETTPAPRR